MSEHFRRYRVRYVWSHRFGHPHHSYEVVGRHGGLHLHISDLGDEHAKKYGERYSAGLESHWREPPGYMADQPPSQDECWLLKQPCWHDGTSLYAQERYVPMFVGGLSPEAMLRALCAEADKRFALTKESE